MNTHLRLRYEVARIELKVERVHPRLQVDKEGGLFLSSLAVSQSSQTRRRRRRQRRTNRTLEFFAFVDGTDCEENSFGLFDNSIWM